MKFALSGVAALALLSLGAGLAHANDSFVFRYKAEIVANTHGDTGGGTGDVGGGDNDTQAGSGIDNVEAEVGDPEVDTSTDPDSPSALSLVPDGSSASVGPDRIIYQCFKVSGGWKNYHYRSNLIWPLKNWMEGQDIVPRSNLGAPFETLSDEEGRILVTTYPHLQPYSFSPTQEDEPCLRIKVKEDALSDQPVSTTFTVADYDPQYIDEEISAIWNAFMYDTANSVTVPVTFTPSCDGGCANDAPPLVVTTVGGSTNLNDMPAIEFGTMQGHGPGPGFNPSPSSITFSGGVPPYDVHFSSDAMGDWNVMPSGNGCAIKFVNFTVLPEFYPSVLTTAVLNASATVTDSVGQTKTVNFTHLLSGYSNNGLKLGMASPEEWDIAADPDNDCDGYPLEAEAIETDVSVRPGVEFETVFAFYGLQPYTFSVENPPPSSQFNPLNGMMIVNDPGSWTGGQAVRVKITDATGDYKIIPINLEVD